MRAFTYRINGKIVNSEHLEALECVKITKLKASSWAGNYVPASYRVDLLNAEGAYVRQLQVCETLKLAEEFAEKFVENNFK